jgi:hypothetical protein
MWLPDCESASRMASHVSAILWSIYSYKQARHKEWRCLIPLLSGRESFVRVFEKLQGPWRSTGSALQNCSSAVLATFQQKVKILPLHFTHTKRTRKRDKQHRLANWSKCTPNKTINNTFFFATIDKVFYYVSSVLTKCFGPYIRPSSSEFTKY